LTLHNKKILVLDLETSPMLAYVWGLGEQHVRHGQLKRGSNIVDIISVAYSWMDEEEIHVMGWGYEEQDSRPMMEKLDELINEADIVIGKNNERFDNKQINFHRWYHNRDGMPDWLTKSDDLEKHLRRHLRLPSQSLDYISDLLGLGGKEKMEFSDWVNIVEKHPTEGLKAYEKMLHYNKKDVADTKAIWKYSMKHFIPKHNMGVSLEGQVCRACGSTNLAWDGSTYSGGVMYKKFKCRDHLGYAGRIAVKGSGAQLK